MYMYIRLSCLLNTFHYLMIRHKVIMIIILELSGSLPVLTMRTSEVSLTVNGNWWGAGHCLVGFWHSAAIPKRRLLTMSNDNSSYAQLQCTLNWFPHYFFLRYINYKY